MRRVILFATIAVCTFALNANARAGAAETKPSVSPALRAIAIEVLIVGAKGEHAVELSGPSDEVAARVRELESEGQIVVIDRVRLTTLEGHKTLVQAGRNAPIATAQSLGGRGGPVQRSYQYQELGTLISATARADGDAVVVELEVEKSQLEQRAGKPRPEDEFVPLGTETLTLQVTARIGSGRTVLAGGLEERADAESSAQLVLASARLLGPSSHAEAIPTAGGAGEIRQTQSTLGDILANALWITVTDGFVLRIHSDQEVARINRQRSAYEDRRRKYSARRTPLEERRESIRRQVPDQRLRTFAQAMLKRYDRDNNGVLDAKEQAGMRPDPQGIDLNKDGSVTSSEMARYLLQQSRGRANSPFSVETVPDNWEEIQDELDAIDAKIEALQEEFEDVLKPLARYEFYKIVEVTREFIRVRHGQEERIIPFPAICEIRRTVPE
jgi:hypothetical protein